MPKTLANFRTLLAEARNQDCLSAAELSAIAEPAIKRVKAVIFDQFPPDEPSMEGAVERRPPRMPP